MQTKAPRSSAIDRWSGRAGSPADQAFLLLRTVFTVAPIAFGLDKFANLLTDWQHYLSPTVDHLVPGTGHQLMLAVGLVEVVAGRAGQGVPADRNKTQRMGGETCNRRAATARPNPASCSATYLSTPLPGQGSRAH